MSLARFEQTLVDDAGNVLSTATVTVRRETSGSPMAVLYSDRAGTVPMANPISITASDDGLLAFHAIGGAYRIEAVSGSYSRTRRYVGIGTAQEQDAGEYALAGWSFEAEAATATPPSEGSIRANNADWSLATHLYIDDASLNGADVTSFLLALAPGTKLVKNRLMLQLGDGRELSWTIDAVTDAGAYLDLTLTAGTYVGPAGPVTMLPVLIKLTTQVSGGNGRQAGLAYKFDNATSGDPGTGHFGLNNATLASVTSIRLSETDGEGNGLGALFATWDDSTTTAARGVIVLRKVGVPATFAAYQITSAITDSGTYDSFTVSHIASGGTFTDEDDFVAEFYRTGNTGATGATGPGAGQVYTYSTTVTDADPGNGIFRLNNATIASATAAYVDNQDANAVSMTAWLDTFDDSTSTIKGLLVIRGVTTPSAVAIFQVTGSVVDGTGYRKLALTHVASGGTWTNAQSFNLNFVPVGDKGTTGAMGPPNGYQLAFSTTITDADPGNGVVRFNHATFASITQVYVDNQDAGGASITAWLDGLDDVVNANARAYLRFQKADDPTVYAEFAVTGAVVNGTGYRKVPVSPVAGVVPADGVTLVATASKSGADGAGDMTSAANPDLVAIEALASTGILARIAINQWAQRSIAAGTGMVVTNGDGVSGNPTIAADIGKKALWVPKKTMLKRTTNGAASGLIELATNKIMVESWDFDASTQEFVQFRIRMPPSWNEGTVTCVPIWSHAATTTNFGVVWGFSGRAFSNDDAGDAAFGTAQTSTDTGGTTNDNYEGPETSAITIAGTPVAGDEIVIQVSRNPADAADTMAIDARLHGVVFYYTIDSLKDS